MIPRPIRSALVLLACTSLPCFGSADSVVVFNEIHYNPAGTSEAGEYVELFNQMGIKVDISGWRIDGIGYTFPTVPATIIDPGAYIIVAKTPAGGQFGPFPGNIGNDGQRLRLINHSDRMMDEVDYGDDAPWPAGADGSGFTLAKLQPYTDSGRRENWTVSAQANGTPGTVNFPAAGAPPPVTTVNLFNLDKVWRYNQNGPAWNASWAQTAHLVGGTGVDLWEQGAGAIGYETAATVPFGSPQLRFPGSNSPYVMTYYFETEFNISAAQLANLATLKIKHALDDGAVIYINGVEATRINMPATGAVISSTPASSSIEAGTALSAYLPLPAGNLVAGSNRLSVEVHQFAVGNSDIVWGAQLDMDISDPLPGTAPPVRLNEIPAATEAAWWVELVNTSAAAADLAGLVINAGGDAAREHVIVSGTLAGGGVLLLDQATLGFRPADGEKVFLYSAGKSVLMDSRQQTGRLRGRAAARSGEWAYPSAATPGAANVFVFNDSVVISEIMYNPPSLAPVPATPPTFQITPLIAFGDTWRYNAADANLAAGWAATEHPVGGGWLSGTGPIGVETAALSVPLVTTIAPYAPATVAYYFEKEFTITAQQIATATSIEITHLIDDGAVFYLNGTEIPSSRFNMAGGAFTPETVAAPSVGDAGLNPLVISTAGLVAGTNRLSVEVHQSSTNSSDIVFGLKMDARVQLTPGSPGQPLRNSDNQWLELTNRSAAPVVLTGWDFQDGINFAFPAGTTLAAGERACVVRDAALFSAAYPAARVLGTFTGSLSRSTEEIVLRDALKNTVDQVRYFDGGQWPRYGDGGGTSIEIRDLDADNNAGSSWAASDESSRTAWRTYSYRGTAAASNGGPDGTWIEFNMGMLSAGELWIDDLNVIELPNGAATPRITDPGFNNATAWRRIGNHRSSQVIPEPGNPGNNILRLVAKGPTEHMHNQIETTLNAAVVNGREYEIRFRARWVAGANQLHTRLYFNRLARVNVIDRVANPGTPGAVNSRAAANAGPSFSRLKHSPAVPAASAVTTISCTAEDPDGIGALTLFYSVNGAAFASTSMSSGGGGNYTGSIPGQAAGAVVQFYISGSDSLGASGFYPAAGPESRALYKVNDNTAATTGWHNFRIITTNADRDWMHTNYNTMSNDLIGCTVIDRESDIYYGAGVHLKSSERGRNQLTRVGYNLTFPPDGLFRGVHESANLDRSEGQAPGQRELLFDVMISNAGGPISRYNDFIKLLAPLSSLTGGAIMQMARYEDLFLEEQFDNGADGHLYEYELVYYPTSADANGNKLIYPSPDGVIGLSFANHGDNPERYRWHFMNKNHREADNFTPLMNYAKLWNKSGAEFEAGVNSLIDLDAWFRGLGCAVLSGATDNYAGDGSAHNAWFYARPDGRVIFLPHDMDNGFNSGLTIFNNPQCAALTANPSRRRLYLGHLHDIITRTYNNSYMSTWTTHLATLDPSQPWSSHLSYITSRSNSVLSQITAEIASVPFAITTASPLNVAASSATVSGNGWVNVRSIRIAGSPEPLTVTWTGASTWQAIVPAAPGSHQITLEAVNFAGAVIGTATITITINSTTQIMPASTANLVISEIMYHPPDPTPAEAAASFTDQDMFEFIELQSITSSVVDMTGVRFTGGIDYQFTSGLLLQPGARVVIPANRSAFLLRYPGASASLAGGSFLNGTQLSNSGESITLTNGPGGTLRAFAYHDTAPWPAAADGNGPSLVLINPATNPDHSVAANWRASTASGGNPGGSDAVSLSGSPTADNDQDGQNALLEHGLGSSDSIPGLPVATAIMEPDGRLTLNYTRRAGADDVIVEAQLSTDLTTWSAAAFAVITETAQPDGTIQVTARTTHPAPAGRAYARVEVRQR